MRIFIRKVCSYCYNGATLLCTKLFLILYNIIYGEKSMINLKNQYLSFGRLNSRPFGRPESRLTSRPVSPLVLIKLLNKAQLAHTRGLKIVIVIYKAKNNTTTWNKQ